MAKQNTIANGRLWKEIVRHRSIYAIMLIPVVYYIIFKYVPIWNGQIAFKDFSARKGVWGSAWCGLDNFKQFLVHSIFGIYCVTHCSTALENF